MSTDLVMEVRNVDEETRIVTGVAVPYDETSYLVPDPRGERVARGCFAKSIRENAHRIPLLVGHTHAGAAVGLSTRWDDDDGGLLGAFKIKAGRVGDETLEDVRTGHLPAMSVGFKPIEIKRGRDGVGIVTQARLLEVSLCAVGAYEGAQVVSVRAAQHVAAMLEPFANPPAVDLSPFARPWA